MLAYSDCLHGASLRALYHAAQRSGPYLLLLRTTDGDVLGAYSHTVCDTPPHNKYTMPRLSISTHTHRNSSSTDGTTAWVKRWSSASTTRSRRAPPPRSPLRTPRRHTQQTAATATPLSLLLLLQTPMPRPPRNASVGAGPGSTSSSCCHRRTCWRTAVATDRPCAWTPLWVWNTEETSACDCHFPHLLLFTPPPSPINHRQRNNGRLRHILVAAARAGEEVLHPAPGAVEVHGRRPSCRRGRGGF